MPAKKFEFIDLVDDLITDFSVDIADAVDETGTTTLNIVEFIEQELDIGIRPTAEQMAVIKSFYGLTLSITEISILQSWYAQERTTWDEESLGIKQQMLVLECGRRGGKTTIASVIAAYEFYCLAKMPNPHAFYGIAYSTPIAILMIATTAEQGKDTIFGATAGVIENCKFFRRLIDRKDVVVGKEEISFASKRIAIHPGNSKSSSQVGYTVKCLIMDEVARFRDADGQSNALEIWSNVGIGSVTFGHHAIRIAISSAWYEGDAIQQLYGSCGKMPGTLGFRLRSWDINPVMAARDNPIIMSEYISNPLQAALEFEGIRMGTEGSFLQGLYVDRANRGKTRIIASPDSTVVRDTKLSTVRIDGIKPGAKNLYMHLDPAISGDSYAAAVAHGEWRDGELFVHVDGLLVWEPKPGQEVSITDVYDTIIGLHHKVGLRRVTADHHGAAAETLQRLMTRGVPAKRIFFSANQQLTMYEYLRRLLAEDRIILPGDSYWSPLLIRELKQLALIRGRKIDHPRDGSKDLADCIAALAWEISRFGVQENLPGGGRAMKTMRTSGTKTYETIARQRRT